MAKVGNIIKTLRKQFKLSQDELASKLNVGKSTISNYETGYSNPDIYTLSKLADIFLVSTDYLLNREVSDISEVSFQNLPIISEINSQLMFGNNEYVTVEVTNNSLSLIGIKKHSVVVVKRTTSLKNNQAVVAKTEDNVYVFGIYSDTHKIIYPLTNSKISSVHNVNDIQLIGAISYVLYKVS